MRNGFDAKRLALVASFQINGFVESTKCNDWGTYQLAISTGLNVRRTTVGLARVIVISSPS